MMSSLFQEMIDSNKIFWLDVNKKNDNDGYLLYEMFHSDPRLIYGISKVALSIAKSKGLKPICIDGLRGRKERFLLTKSMNDCSIGNFSNFLLSSVSSCPAIFRMLFSIHNKAQLLAIEIDGYHIGPYIYDAALRKLNLSEISNITSAVKKVILLELCYFYFFKKPIENLEIKTIVLGDNVYRCGLLFELAKKNNIECITPVHLNGFSMCRHVTESDFEHHDRKPDVRVLEQLDTNQINKYLESYFSKRFSASLEQHDVMKAFSDEKTIFNRSEIIESYNLKDNLPIVIVMSHIFCDAPHAYPGMLYNDYRDWLVNTVKALKLNPNVNFLVKEHPSADLFNERGIINEVLRDLGCESSLLQDNVHNLTILNEFDIVVTCGGTIGQEFSYKGKPVVLAAKPPYSGFGFTTEPHDRSSYEALMCSGIENLRRLDDQQRLMVNKVIYHDFVMLDSYSDELEIGGQRFYMGREFDDESFYGRVLTYNEVPLEEQFMYKKISSFINSNEKHLLRGRYD
ncbi:hypothetical protein ACODM8_05535 [Vibrio ostreicida]|uniref:Capsule biosynthesis protein n=1 Tax=Vibrio ostreicida TaxID=526588 RepID=A0ABT8BQF2_9VIBR|nr:hypothetical protein [Vibrio ostreicida]MDN3608480.1 hypothetical protein [Vibrio ostreicida]NPD10302.1 hypothetical protein [Vibrio ostreicida]